MSPGKIIARQEPAEKDEDDEPTRIDLDLDSENSSDPPSVFHDASFPAEVILSPAIPQ
jgi:hypothetical protein